ncbi:hypothetical protein GVX82_03530 [Patescibacteria group bacterium]|jgi:hypothetical protein|nr:hypothetical protein [Patescibacteria group bacterium]
MNPITTFSITGRTVAVVLAILAALAGSLGAVLTHSSAANAWHCTLSADHPTITRGESTTLTWDAASDVAYVTIEGVAGEQPQDGSLVVTPEETTTYVAYTHVDWTDDTLQCSVTVEVEEAAAPTCDLSVSSTTVAPGEAVSITWSSENAASASFSGFSDSGSLSGSASAVVSDSMSFSATFTSEDGQQVTCEEQVSVEEPAKPTPPHCPIEEAEGRTIVDFDGRLLSGRGAAKARTDAVATALPAGTYSVTLAAWDGYVGREDVSQPTETYRVVAVASDGTETRSNESPDVTDNVREAEVVAQVHDQNFVLTQAATEVFAQHGAPGDTSSANSVNPICVAFDVVAEEPEEEPVAPACPLSDGVIVEFSDERLLSGRGHDRARSADYAVDLAPGTYEVELVAWDGYLGREHVTQPTEQYKVIAGGVHTGATSDVADQVREAVARDVVNTELVLSEAVTSVHAKHATWQSTDTANSVVPICASFTKKEAPKPAPVCEVGVADPIIEAGSSTTLTWESEHVASTSFDQGVGAVAPSGSQTVSPPETTTYTGTFVSTNGDTITCDATVTVTEAPEAPVCSLSVTPGSISSERAEVTVSWSSENVVAASINQGIGSVAVEGATTTTPGGAQTYTGTFVGASGEEITCSDSVVFTRGGGGGGGGGGRGPCLNCDDDDDDDDDRSGGGGGSSRDEDPEPEVSVASRVVPATPGSFVTLDQVPYTGFEASPLVTALFWIGLLLLSMGISYLLVVRQVFGRLVPAVVGAPADPAPTGARPSTEQLAPEAETAPTQLTPYRFQEFEGGEGRLDIESKAQAAGVLFSPEAQVRVARIAAEEGEAVLDQLIALAKDTYTPEDGWILLSKDRTETLLAKRSTPRAPREEQVRPQTPQTTPTSTAPQQQDSPLSAALNTLTGGQQAPPQPAAPQMGQTPAPTQRPQAAPLVQRAGSQRPEADVATFVSWIVEGKQQEAYEYLRSAQSADQLIGEVVRALDEVYKNRLEGGRQPEQQLVQLTAGWSNPDFEAVIGTLVESVDYSYQSSRIGTKVALAKLFERFGN